MEQSETILQRVTDTLEKYRKNKTLVSPADLEGKYRVPFQKLKKQLADELSEYLKAYSLERLQLTGSDHFEEFAESVNQIFRNTDMGKRVGKAAFKEFDIAQVTQIAEELRIKVFKEAYVPYFQKHICLYAAPECFSENNPHIPRIYNSLVDKFWDEQNRKWISDEAAGKPAMLIFIQEGK